MAGKWKLKDHDSERRLFGRRLAFAVAVMGLLVAALVANLVGLQVFQHEYYSTRSDDNRLHSQHVAPARGLVFDRRGELLADNRPIFTLTVVREQVGDLERTLRTLGGLVRLSRDDIDQFRARLQRRRVPFSSVPLRYVLTERERSKVAVNSHRLPGVAIEPQLVRRYPLGELAAHALGYVSEINRRELDGLGEADRENYGGTNHIGKTGVEKTYERLLHGTVGYEVVEKNNRGQIMRRLDRTDPVPGRNISLHLDARLQAAAGEALGEFRGAAVAIEPATGGILAMVSKPAFDPNLFVTGISGADYRRLVADELNTPLFDRAVNPYPPASTVKPFIGLAGLQLGLIDYEHTVEDPGYFRLPGGSRRYHDWTWRTEMGGGHGAVDLRRAIYQSCDTYFYDLGSRMGIDAMHGFLSAFGFGRNLALDVPYAREGVLPSTEWKLNSRGERWYPGETVSSSIGQGYMWVTPLQLATAAAVLAGGGRMVPPRMLKAVDGEAFEPVAGFAPADVALDDPEHWRYMERAMADVVHRPYQSAVRDYGGAYPYVREPDPDMSYRIAGKTGTAQVVGIAQSVGRGDELELAERHKDHGLFIAYAPAGHPTVPPRIALAVFVQNGESGAAAAAPVAKRIIDAYLLDILHLDLAAPRPAPPSGAAGG